MPSARVRVNDDAARWHQLGHLLDKRREGGRKRFHAPIQPPPAPLWKIQALTFSTSLLRGVPDATLGRERDHLDALGQVDHGGVDQEVVEGGVACVGSVEAVHVGVACAVCFPHAPLGRRTVDPLEPHCLP